MPDPCQMQAAVVATDWLGTGSRASSWVQVTPQIKQWLVDVAKVEEKKDFDLPVPWEAFFEAVPNAYELSIKPT